MKHTKQIHVVYIITKLELGGAQKVCLALYNGLQDTRFSSSLISGKEGPLIHVVSDNPNTIFLRHLIREVSLLNIFNEIQLFFTLRQHLKKLKKTHPNIVVHTHSTKAGIMGRWAAFFAGIKIRVHTVHGYGFHTHQSWIGWICTYSLELLTSLITTHFVCVSSTDVKTGTTLLPTFDRKHSIIRAAVDTQQFYTPAYRIPTPSTIPNFVFGTIACFKPQKNIFELLKAFELVHAQASHTRLEIIGDGIQRAAIQAWIDHHNLSSIITLHGFQEQVAPFMHTWNAFALSSLWEGLPCAIVEARLVKLPVISYDTGGIHEVIFHQKNGLLCSQKDWHTLAANMLTIVTNPVLYQSLRNHKDNLIDFEYPHMIQEHKTLYEKLVQQ